MCLLYLCIVVKVCFVFVGVIWVFGFALFLLVCLLFGFAFVLGLFFDFGADAFGADLLTYLICRVVLLVCWLVLAIGWVWVWVACLNCCLLVLGLGLLLCLFAFVTWFFVGGFWCDWGFLLF